MTKEEYLKVLKETISTISEIINSRGGSIDDPPLIQISTRELRDTLAELESVKQRLKDSPVEEFKNTHLICAHNVIDHWSIEDELDLGERLCLLDYELRLLQSKDSQEKA